jgi:CubicO group peptidase (beta-lactamase class C family)
VNQVFVASVNASQPSGVGHTVLVGPEGNVLAELPGSNPGVLTSVIDLDLVSNARRYGSFGLTRMWSQMRDDDDPIPLPLYGGAITARRWSQPPADQAPDRPSVTIANWLEPQNIPWSFQHVADLLPVAEICRGSSTGVQLPRHELELGSVPVPLGGETTTVDEILAATDTDAWIVLADGKVVTERYFGQMGPATPHLLQSVSKSVVSTVAGALVARERLDVTAAVTDYVPELAETGYAGATVRQLLDMRTGVAFIEDYFDPASDSRRLEAAMGWAPPCGDTDAPRSTKDYLRRLTRARPHGGAFEYRSCETDVLGWVCEAAGGAKFSVLASELVWSKIGAQYDAQVCLDAEGTAVFDGGICAAAGDLARFGAMMLRGGLSLTGHQVVSKAWVHDMFTGDADNAQAFAQSPQDHGMPGGSYRSNFWLPAPDVALGIGIHGQLVYLNRAHGVVAVKLSSWPQAQDARKSAATLHMCDAISRHLSAQRSTSL